MSTRSDGEMHRYLGDRQVEPVTVRKPPPQIITAGDEHGSRVRIVFSLTGQKVPWDVQYVNCPARYLMRFDSSMNTKNLFREDGDFRVIWWDE